MSSSAVLKTESQPLVACTISRDVQIFDLLIEDMEAALGETWGDLGFDDAEAFLQQSEADDLQFVAVAMDQDDEQNIEQIGRIIGMAKSKSIKVILITEDVSPASLHQLLRQGGDEFVPYPLPENELANAIERVLAPEPEVQLIAEQETKLKATGDKEGVLIAVHGMAGGTGATTLAVNLAWELANVDKDNAPRVCLLDFDFQFGSAATFLDLARRETVLELLTDTEAMDSESFMQALMTYEEKLQVLTSPMDMIPLDLITPTDIERIIEVARTNFDYVIIDMPSTMVEWSQTVLETAHVYFATLELDMRSAQNTLRLKRALQSEDLPFDKLRFVLNKAPGFTDLNGKSRVKRLAESLGISIEVQLPDGGKPVAQNADHGVPLATGVPKNATRKEIMKLAQSVHAVNADEAEARG
ncbi:pilus assembly protein CpaE [Cognatiyoonia sediminum]|uniref:Pilus assembly protein CpaE n=1 Tax=Cognatiyoonia sediminum TaxID=1508389 RepID=A0A1M5NC94_9RHOB|nr:AAA family ATPase [Cognatiyoonia sediminum]SHG87194.1 pilus assembly protein CpaE [Cognatiyoonia sediminum]